MNNPNYKWYLVDVRINKIVDAGEKISDIFPLDDPYLISAKRNDLYEKGLDPDKESDWHIEEPERVFDNQTEESFKKEIEDLEKSTEPTEAGKEIVRLQEELAEYKEEKRMPEPEDFDNLLTPEDIELIENETKSLSSEADHLLWFQSLTTEEKIELIKKYL